MGVSTDEEDNTQRVQYHSIMVLPGHTTPALLLAGHCSDVLYGQSNSELSFPTHWTPLNWNGLSLEP